MPPPYLELIEPLHGVLTMLELGNKRGTGGPGDPYKDYFERRGIRHTSVDLNGLDGALALDLRAPLNLGKFDMVTNIGTSEHVDDQRACWRNIIESASKFIVCITPRPGDWPGHGLFYPAHDFYVELAHFNGFHIERLYEAGPEGRGFVFARLARRVEFSAFTMPVTRLTLAPPRRKR